MAERTVDIVYADDIRFEKSEQISLVGVYSRSLKVPSFPFVMPKLCLWLRARTDKTDLFKSVKILLINDQGEKIAEIDVDELDLAAQGLAVEQLDWSGLENEQLEFVITSQISPVVIHAPTLIRASVITERETLRCPALRVELDRRPSGDVNRPNSAE